MNRIHPSLCPRYSAPWLLIRCACVWLATYGTLLAGDDGVQATAAESAYYRIVSIDAPPSVTDSRSKHWKPSPDGLALEVSGIAVLDEHRAAVAIRKGEVWISEVVFAFPPEAVRCHRFASGLHEPLGLLYHAGAYYTAQRAELTRLRDCSGDGLADEYWTLADGWDLTGHYHEYAYGPKLDAAGNLWVTLNIGMGLRGNELRRTIHEPTLNYRQAAWRGWALKIAPDGRWEPVCAGMRSPCGLGANAEGDMFYTDQQGNWVATNSLHHLRPGVFYHHPESLASMNLPGSTVSGVTRVPSGLPLPEALAGLPQMQPPAVWFPHKKMGQSTTDIMLRRQWRKVWAIRRAVVRGRVHSSQH